MAVDHGKIQADYLDFMKVVRSSKASNEGKASNASKATVYVNDTPFPKDYNIMTVGEVEAWRQQLEADFLRGGNPYP